MKRGVLVPVLLAALSLPTTAEAGGGGRCPRIDEIEVPRAEKQKKACLDDLTTAGTKKTGHTNESDWSGLHAKGTRNPTGIPGIQVDGYFPDDSTTNSNNGWFHDSQFVIRLPHRWNGKLVVTGAPGVRRQYANDFIISDWVLARGYAFASTDKGNTGVGFYQDGEKPGDAILEWHRRVTQLTRASKAVVRQRYGKAPVRTYVTGISNGGYLTRFALERHPELYDGGVDWEGTLFTPPGPHILTYLPVALRNYPDYRATGSDAAHDAMIEAGFAPGSEFLWDYHYLVYWDLTQRIYREELDPGYDGPLSAGIPFCQQGMPSCDANYQYHQRPSEVRSAVARVSVTGKIAKPMLTLHGTLDSLLPIRDSDVYRQLVTASGRRARHRYYRIEDGNHVDGLYDEHPDNLRPLLPCQRAAFLALEGWVERGDRPPRSRFVPKPAQRDVVNSCSIGDVTYRAPGESTASRQVGTSFPEDFPVIKDASLGVPVIGFGGRGPVRRTPVVFLHGNNDTPYPTDCNSGFGHIHDFAQHFLDHGYRRSELWALGYQGDQCDLRTEPTNRSGKAHSTVANVPDLRRFVHAVLDYTGARRVDIVGHSLGATLAREWMRRDDAYPLVRRLVSVDGPNHGIINCSPSPRNYWQNPALGGFNPDSAICREYGAAGTPLLRRLNSGDETPGPTRYMAIANADSSFVFFPKQDGTIPPVPAEDRHGRAHDFSRSARLRGAVNIGVVGQGRHDDVLLTAHLGIVNSPQVWKLALEFLAR